MQCLSVRVWLLLATVTLAVWSASAQTQYTTDGTPTGLEEEIRWRVNRGRFDTASENATRGTAYTDVPATAGPLAPNQSITMAARHQSEDLAKANLFQHATVPGSLFYNPTTQPNPWDRMTAEGYTWNAAGENIAAGYSGAETAYVGWWNSTGHRQNMYTSSLREIGNGYFLWTSATYRHYYTMDLGSSGTTCFLTDTAFRDANGNGVYEQSEAVAGLAIRLRVGNVTHNYFDVSAGPGSFAIPLSPIASGATVTVVLSNTTLASMTLSIPRDYRNYTTVVLAAGESRTLGTFIRAAGGNVGWRDVVPEQAGAPMATPRVNLARTGNSFTLSWNSTVGLEYQPQWSTDLATWNVFTNTFRPGTGSNMVQLDTSAGGPRKFYRVFTRRP